MYLLAENKSLKQLNTFGIPVNARYFLSIENSEDLIRFFSENPQFRNEPMLVLGGGSNLLFLEDFEGLIIHPRIKNFCVVSETDENIEIEAGAGEKWDKLVEYCVQNGWGGIENLSLIPGHVGAVPVQNIGAYGVEAGSVIARVHALNLQDFSQRTFLNAECEFGYRDSIFKNKMKDQFLITSVVFLLKKKPVFNFSYGALKNLLPNSGQINLALLRKTIISIRESKLPDPGVIGNAGSFFKNPYIDAEKAKKIQLTFPEVPLYPCEENQYKISAGWLIEKSGWKGKTYKNAGVHDQQALVLINRGEATGREIFELAELIRKDVYTSFGISLEPEVNIIDRR